MFKRFRKPMLVAASLAGVSLIAFWFFVLRRPPDIRESLAMRAEWEVAGVKIDELAQEQLAARSLEIGRKYPGTTGGLLALQMAGARAAKTPSGQQALLELARQVKAADIDPLAQALYWGLASWKSLAPCAPAVLARARQSAEHPQSGRLLAVVCLATRPDEGKTPPAVYCESADLIADQFADRADIYHFCESLEAVVGYTPPWAADFERHLRAILKVNEDRYVRCVAQFALATLTQSAAQDRQAEAETLFEEFCAEFDGKHAYQFQSIEQMLLGEARNQLKELQFRAVGKLAPEIVGVDLQGRPMRLSDYRGKAVLLSYWGTWCFPCMKLVPHERELANRLRGRPFEIVGVNCDDDAETARQAVTQHQMVWPMFFNKPADGPGITGDWKIMGFPTLYLIDHNGVIRRRWIGAPPNGELDRMSDILVDAAERKLTGDAMKPVSEALVEVAADRAVPTVTAATVPPSDPLSPGAGFQDRVFHAADGSESKYMIFVPSTFNGAANVPAVMFLHGVGSSGSDGKRHVEHGLAKAIRVRPDAFPLLAIFPQAHEGENWTSASTGGKRALAILDQVQTEFKIDVSRIYLTGLSMGGEGTWSLAAAEPHRWAAIVPVAHGWKIDAADRLKQLPCWCFHGVADKMIPIEQSRDMVRAIRASGGRPLYQEFPGVGHDDCADRVYAMPELYEWLLLQQRTRQ